MWPLGLLFQKHDVSIGFTSSLQTKHMSVEIYTVGVCNCMSVTQRSIQNAHLCTFSLSRIVCTMKYLVNIRKTLHTDNAGADLVDFLESYVHVICLN
jgi:hypothetical protein